MQENMALQSKISGSLLPQFALLLHSN